MTWQDLFTWMKFFGTGLLAAWGTYTAWQKFRVKKKTTEGELNIESFNSILKESKDLRQEFKIERDFLKEELRKEREVVDKMAKMVIANETRIQQILLQNKVLVHHLKNMLGLKNIVNVKNIKIAVLEDNPDDTILLQRLFKSQGIDNVTFYSDRSSFVDGIDSNVRILIVDHKLSGESTGLEIIREIINAEEYRFFIMLSGIEDFNVIYNFNRLVTHGVYILKGRPESDDLIIKSIRNTVYYLNILSDTYNEINALKTEVTQ